MIYLIIISQVPEGILNLHGSNEIALTLWSLGKSFVQLLLPGTHERSANMFSIDEGGAKIANLQLVTLGVFSSGKEVVSSNTVASPTFQQLRQ